MTSAIEREGEHVLGETTSGRASLAYTDQTVPTVPPLSCPYARDRVIVELVSGSVFPDRCRSNQCLVCLPLNARRRCLAITYAAPERMIRLSMLAGEGDGDPCSTARGLMKLIRRNLKRMGYQPGEWCWTIEPNPKGGGYHAHALQRGRSIPQAELQEACARSGAGMPDIRSIKRKGIWTSRYGLKGFGADGYGLKSFRANGDPTEALRINHGKVEHHSPGFFAIDGDVLRVREYERLAIAEMNEFQNVAYIGCAPSRVDTILSIPRVRASLIRDLNHRSASKLRALGYGRPRDRPGRP